MLCEMNNTKIIAGLIICLIITGCGHKAYSGRFWIADSRSASSGQLLTIRDEVEKTVRDVAAEFGFTEDKKLAWMSDDTISFGKREKSQYDHLDGSDSAISLLIQSNPYTAIAIKDYSNTVETSFVNSFNLRLVKKIKENLDLKITFRRHWDLMD